MSELQHTTRTHHGRHPERGSFDRALAYRLLDEAHVAHVGITTPDGPLVIPMVYGRHGDDLYLHGSQASRLMRALLAGQPLCFTVTLVDGLVLARSAFYHSANYRSLVAFGVAHPVDDDEKRLASQVLVDHLAAGRSTLVRPPTDKERKATAFVRFRLDEASLKVRSGANADAPDDLADDSPWRHVWAGVVPLTVIAGDPIPDALTITAPPLSP